MSLIRRRSEPFIVKHLRRNLLFSGNPEKDKQKKENHQSYNPSFPLIIFTAHYMTSYPAYVIQAINDGLDKIKKHYTSDMIASAAPPGYFAVNITEYRAERLKDTAPRLRAASFQAVAVQEDSYDSHSGHICSNNLAVPKMLFNTGTEEALMTEIEVITELFSDFFTLAADKLEFGSKNNPGYLLVLDRTSLQIQAQESHMKFAFQQLFLECIDTLKSLSARQSYLLPRHNILHGGVNRGVYLDTEKQARKINKLMINLEKTYKTSYVRRALGTRNITIPSNVYNASLSQKLPKKYEYNDSIHNTGVATALAEGMHIAGDIVLYTPEEISSVFRGELIETLMQRLSNFASVTKFILRKYVRHTLSGKSPDLGWALMGVLSILDTLGVPNSEKQVILNKALSKYDPLVKRDSSIANLIGASPALRKFVNKVGMPIDLENTYDPTAEKQIAKRLRDLSKALSAKYSVDYASNAGDVVLAAMRKAEDLDEIMLDVSAALGDCINYINAAADPS